MLFPEHHLVSLGCFPEKNTRRQRGRGRNPSDMNEDQENGGNEKRDPVDGHNDRRIPERDQDATQDRPQKHSDLSDRLHHRIAGNCFVRRDDFRNACIEGRTENT